MNFSILILWLGIVSIVGLIGLVNVFR